MPAKLYTDIISKEIHQAGWTYGHASYMDTGIGEQMYVTDAHKPGRMRCVARAETLLTALMELQAMIAKADRAPV